MKEINGVKEIDMKVYEELIEAAKATPKMTNEELIKRLKKAISDINAVMEFVPYEQDRIYSCIEGISNVIEHFAMDGPDTIRYPIIDEG